MVNRNKLHKHHSAKLLVRRGPINLVRGFAAVFISLSVLAAFAHPQVLAFFQPAATAAESPSPAFDPSLTDLTVALVVSAF